MKLNINTYFGYSKYLGTEKFAKEISKTIKKGKNGYAGWKKREWLEYNLRFNSKKGEKEFQGIENLGEKCEKIIKDTVGKVKRFLPGEIFFYVFPTPYSEVLAKMGGSSGSTIWKDTVYVYIFPEGKWEESLQSTVIHELTHIITGYHYGNDFPLGECLIHEGLAENFRGSILGGSEPWTRAISKKKSQEILSKLKSSLDIKPSRKKYSDLFFGTGNYPHWAGYTIGYNLVKDYLKRKYPNGKIDWKEVFEMKPKNILMEALKVI